MTLTLQVSRQQSQNGYTRCVAMPGERRVVVRMTAAERSGVIEWDWLAFRLEVSNDWHLTTPRVD